MDRITQEAYYRQRIPEDLRKGHGVTETVLRYRVSRKTVYKWLKIWDGIRKSLLEYSHQPQHSPRAHTEGEIRLIKRSAKKHHKDILLAYQKAREHGYTRSYVGFKRVLRKLLLHI